MARLKMREPANRSMSERLQVIRPSLHGTNLTVCVYGNHITQAAFRLFVPFILLAPSGECKAESTIVMATLLVDHQLHLQYC